MSLHKCNLPKPHENLLERKRTLQCMDPVGSSLWRRTIVVLDVDKLVASSLPGLLQQTHLERCDISPRVGRRHFQDLDATILYFIQQNVAIMNIPLCSYHVGVYLTCQNQQRFGYCYAYPLSVSVRRYYAEGYILQSVFV